MTSDSELTPAPALTITPSRKGKIGRLTLKIREEINMRLADGMEATPLLAWLNALPNVREILRNHFASRPVTPQNLSEWRQGGYQDWVLNRQTSGMARSLAEEAAAADEQMGSKPFSEHLSTVMALKLAQVATPLMSQTGGDLNQRWNRTRQVIHELCRIRRADYLAARARLIAEQAFARSTFSPEFDMDSSEESRQIQANPR